MAWLANDKYSASLTSGYTTGQTTLSVSAVPDNVPTIVVLAKGTDKETVFTVTGKTVNSLTGVTRIRGANVNLDATTPVTCLNNMEFVNQYANSVSSAETLANIVYSVDGGSTDDYVVSLDPAPTEYTEGLWIIFKANTTNTGAATLNANSLGAKTIKKNVDQDLADGDIQADQVVIVVYDGTNFQLQNEKISLLDEDNMASNSDTQAPTQQSVKAYVDTEIAGIPSPGSDGWVTSADTWVYASASTFTISGVDRTAIYTKGTRLRFKQGGAYKYAVVLSSSFSTNTTVTIAINTDYTIANATITDNYYSYQISPQGYPDWFAYTPTGPTNTTLTGRYRVNGHTCHAMIKGAVTGTPSFASMPTLPIQASASMLSPLVQGSYTDAGTANRFTKLYAAVGASSTTAPLYSTEATSGDMAAVSATVPITWASTDTWNLAVEYEI